MSVQAEPNVGDIIGGYSLESILGKGGMGSVYRAHHTRLGRKAAVKLLSSNLAADEEYVSRFFHEARIVNEIGHPDIIDIIDFVEDREPRRVAYIMCQIIGRRPFARSLSASGP